jgi:hypothetical protein|tara:strand:+ start:974 stop:1522 length:549 start_codon:yes stop_codon:yes gene_type:complete
MFRKLTIYLALFLLLAGCSKEGHIDIEVESRHLDELPAGKWIAAFEIKYAPFAEELKKQILQKLRQEGEIKDEYRYEENGNVVTTSLWRYRGYTIKEQYYQGGIWRGPKIIPYQEYYQGELAVWFTVEYQEGVPYSELLPKHYKLISPNRKYEHTATIKSKQDKARLFLFGNGSRCQRISLF